MGRCETPGRARARLAGRRLEDGNPELQHVRVEVLVGAPEGHLLRRSAPLGLRDSPASLAACLTLVPSV